MQVSGRAARNVNGKVLLYADKLTDSIKYLIKETKRRRKTQKDFNVKNNITPQSIVKSLEDINLSTRVADEKNEEIKQSEELDLNFENMEIVDALKMLKKNMLKASKNLQFEEAAHLRDKIKELQRDENINLL